MSSVEDEDYYHGMLPREDMNELFKEGGDYLVRMSHTKRDGESQFVISLSSNTEKANIKHFLILSTPNGYTVDKAKFFPDIVQLVKFYSTEKIGLDGTADTILKRALTRAKWELSHDQITMEKKIGEGVFACVMKGVLRIPGRVPVKVAVKMAKKDAGNIEKIKEILKEARIMRNFIHPNVVRIFGVAVQKEPLLIVMELMSAGDLRSFLRSQPSTPGKKLQWISEAAYGLEYLHSKRCIHRDIAARNCLLTSKHRLKLSDFGLSRIGETYRMATARKMPIKWIPPEIIRNNMFSLKSDVWSYGILVWEIMANGATPYNALPNAKVRELILAGEKNVFPKGSDPEVVQFVETRCWLMDPSKRCTMSEAAEVMSRLSGSTNPMSSSSTSLIRSRSAPSRTKTMRASRSKLSLLRSQRSG